MAFCIGRTTKRKSINTAKSERLWLQISEFKVLVSNLRRIFTVISTETYKEMLEKEQEYEMYSDSESARAAKLKKAEKRLHPVNSLKSKSVDSNSVFEKVKLISKSFESIINSNYFI